MYRIVNYDVFQSVEHTFSDFSSAFMTQQLSYPDYIIEYWSDEGNEVVWNPEWENMELNKTNDEMVMVFS